MLDSALVDRLWAQIEPIAFITRGQFARGLEAWEIEPVYADGELAFAVLTQGPECHFASFGVHVPITMKMIRARIEPIVARYGYVTTKTPKEDARQHRFNALIGFARVGEDEFFTHFRMDAPRCQ